MKQVFVTRFIVIGSAMAVFALGACSTQDRAHQGSAMNKAASVASEVSGPTDAEIAHVVKTTNDSEIASAQLAKQKSKNKEVLSYANHIVSDHQAMNKQVATLAARLGAKPEGNVISASMQTGANATMSSLKDLNGKEFEKAYMDQQVTMHESVLNTLNNTLLPNAKDQELKSMLEASRPKLEGHLAHAKQLQEKLTK